MSRDAEVFERLTASDVAKRAYENDPVFRHVVDAVRLEVSQGAEPLEAIGKALAMLTENRRKDTAREAARRVEGGPRSTLKPWWS